MPANTLVFAWGNPSRGDDALGPLFAEAVQAMNLPQVECLTDFQLQIEHSLDLLGRRRILFVDASCGVADGVQPPFHCAPLQPARDSSYTTHAMSPAALLQVFTDVQGHAPPTSWLLAIPGESWELGQPPTVAAQERLAQALDWAAQWLRA
jgi:hydrogenase maturation protease